MREAKRSKLTILALWSVRTVFVACPQSCCKAPVGLGGWWLGMLRGVCVLYPSSLSTFHHQNGPTLGKSLYLQRFLADRFSDCPPPRPLLETVGHHLQDITASCFSKRTSYSAHGSLSPTVCGSIARPLSSALLGSSSHDSFSSA